MRLEIVGGGYGSARTAFGEANQLAARAREHLLDALADTGGMAGDDSTSQTFAAAYDVGAAEALGSLADLVGSFEGLGRLTEVTLSHHARAESRSVVGGAPVYEGGWLPQVGPDSGYVTVLPATPPTALGSNECNYGRMVGWVLDQVQGFVWPNAETTRLRAAARAWQDAAERVADLVVACDCAVQGFWRERSPEVPMAIEATHELRQTASFISDQYAALGAACDAYADQVDAKRHEVVELAESLLQQCVEGIALSVGLGLLTGGAGAWGGGAATAARVTSEAPRFLEILTSLRALSGSAAESVRAARGALVSSRGVLAKFKDARAVRAVDDAAAPTVRTLGDEARLDQIRQALDDPGSFDPEALRGLSKGDVSRLVSQWEREPSARGLGVVYKDPLHYGRRIRIMDGYPGNRPDPLTHGPYVVVSQNGVKMKLPLEGNPLL